MTALQSQEKNRIVRRHIRDPRAPAFLLLITVLLSQSCSSSDQILGATGIRQSVYLQKTDLLLTELHYPITNNANLDGLLRERILSKYRAFRKHLNEDSIKYLNRGTAFIYRATFDALRSPDLRIISFVLYETREVQRGQTNIKAKEIGNSSPGTIVLQAQESSKSKLAPGENSTTEAETFMYSLRFGTVVDFGDVVAEPLLVFRGLAASCLRQLDEYIGRGNYYSQGIQPDREHLDMLSFGKSGIQVSFPPGQIMNRDQGVVSIFVPWGEAIATEPWQYGIIHSFRPLGYRSRKKASDAGTSAAYVEGTRTLQ